MLYLALIFVLAALGFLITAFLVAPVWAWPSIGLSVAAGVVLVVDWWRGRRQAGAADDPGDETAADADSGSDTEAESATATTDGEDPAEGAEEPAVAEAVAEAEDPDAEPAEEDTDAADLLVVSELEDEVMVVDEHPRYHLGDCGWLSDKDTIPIAVAEARELGFTPCARCGPDATLAATRRTKKRKSSWISRG